jgi:hypothetical protein
MEIEIRIKIIKDMAGEGAGHYTGGRVCSPA